ncbi:MAG: NAD-dependent epimerase/dehydratase family protein [Spirochaetia bacterium]|nr:NAD-dependent epimerase/dehydratase family protein [Spirochaetia bacterium]
MKPISTEDLDHVFVKTNELWATLGGKRIFITGGSGFVGRWLIETALYAQRRLNVFLSVDTITRDPEQFRRNAAHLVGNPALKIHAGDLEALGQIEGPYDYVVHAAADTHVSPERADDILASSLTGTRAALDFARRVKATDFLFTSSGAAYGRQPVDMFGLAEGYQGGPDTTNPSSAYGEGKRLAELMCASCFAQSGLRTKIARLFAFIGPHLALDRQYAAGNFIRDALRGETVRIGGDGTDRRSYLYAADMAIWLWTILFQGAPCRLYNVGSGQEISILDLAQAIAKFSGNGNPVSIAQASVPGRLPARYIPDIARTQTELQLQEWVPLTESIKRTIVWFQDQISSNA